MTSKIKELSECQPTFNDAKYHECQTRLWKSVVEAEKDVISFVKQISSSHNSYVKIKKDLETVQQSLSICVPKLERLQKQLEEESKAKQVLAKKQSLNLRHCNQYTQYLGFEIKLVMCDPNKDLYCTKFSFKNIHKVHQDKFYSFILILQNDSYKVSECLPLIPELNEMVQDLNKTNDLHRFIKQVRRKFCALSCSKEPLNDCTNDPS
ncbi:hypothetical protein JTE90_014940 [Oedothorax gibbosus]|uniref:Kinetochore protein SPC25 n=1 Tax=Oedothorax gibbosus TaxID=931172 RepID=A0AAV6VLD9_9ARAC|nr:hypothetical protein JTE90_014940 [Oedothorax gibbosus]